MRKIGEQWYSLVDGVNHLMQCTGYRQIVNRTYRYNGTKKVPVADVVNTEETVDLGAVNENGCLPTIWDRTQYPKISCEYSGSYCVYAVLQGGLGKTCRMETHGATKDEAIALWNRRDI